MPGVADILQFGIDVSLFFAEAQVIIFTPCDHRIGPVSALFREIPTYCVARSSSPLLVALCNKPSTQPNEILQELTQKFTTTHPDQDKSTMIKTCEEDFLMQFKEAIESHFELNSSKVIQNAFAVVGLDQLVKVDSSYYYF